MATPKQAFATAVAGTAVNPLTIALWTVSFPASAPHAAAGSTADALLLLCGVAFGTIGWYGGVALSVAATRGLFGPKVLQTIDIRIGAALMALGPSSATAPSARSRANHPCTSLRDPQAAS